MSAELTFVDTNILVYAYDSDAGFKHDRAKRSLRNLWEAEAGAASTQVLQEFYVTVTRKLQKPLAKRAARQVIEAYRAWPIHRPDVDDIIAASELEERHRLAFWDALLVVAAKRSSATTLLTEDLQEGRRFDDIVVVNPFAQRPAVEGAADPLRGPRQRGRRR